MLSARLTELLVRQVQSELTAHQNYMAISIYFERRALRVWAKLFHDQALEEASHAAKILKFLVDNEVDFDLPGLAPASTHFSDEKDAVRSAQQSEARVSAEFQAMAKVASEDHDFRGFQFLQWFIEEQVEEEAKMRDLMDLLESGINVYQAEPLLGTVTGE